MSAWLLAAGPDIAAGTGQVFSDPVILCASDIIENYQLTGGEVQFLPYHGPLPPEGRWVEVQGMARCKEGEPLDSCQGRALIDGLCRVWDKCKAQSIFLLQQSGKVKRGQLQEEHMALQGFLLIHPGLTILERQVTGGEYRLTFKAKVSPVPKQYLIREQDPSQTVSFGLGGLSRFMRHLEHIRGKAIRKMSHALSRMGRNITRTAIPR